MRDMKIQLPTARKRKGTRCCSKEAILHDKLQKKNLDYKKLRAHVVNTVYPSTLRVGAQW